MKRLYSKLNSGRLALAACAALMPFGAALADKNIFGLENPVYGQKTEAAPQENPVMNCPQILILGNSIPDCTARGAQGPMREDPMGSARQDAQRHELFLPGGKGTS
jgi:hypothetical protein